VALLVQFLIVRDLLFPVFLRGDARRDPLFQQGFAEPVGVIAFVRQKMIGGRELIHKHGSAFEVADLTGGQAHETRTPLPITNRMQLAVQAAFCAANVAGNIPFLSRLEAVRCTFR